MSTNVRKFRLALTVLTLVALMLSVFGAVPAMAQTGDRGTAILAAADRLANVQNDDGGFDWGAPDGNKGNSSPTNTLGVTAMGILKANELSNKATYETALAKAFKFANDKPPGWTWDGSSKYDETTAGVNSYPDITFLIWLAQAAARDSSLLSAIDGQVSGTTAADIADLAKTRWDDKVEHLGASSTPPNGTATTMAQRIRDDRHSQGWDSLIPWDLEAGVKAALALDSYYPGQGYDGQAEDIADVIYNSVDDIAVVYFDSTDTNQEGYVLGLTGAIEAYCEVDKYSTEASDLKDKLIAVQDADGWWKYHGASPGDKSVQDTAYAVMALLAQGDADAVTAAAKGADWLVSSQKLDGGWDAEDGAGEYTEVDSEAAWALAHPTFGLEIAAPGWLAECNDDTIIVNVMMTASNFNGVEFDLDFDKDLLEVVDANGASPGMINMGSMWPGSATNVQNTVDNINGTIDFGAYLQDPDTDMSVSGGQVAQIEFKELNDAGTSDLDLNEVIVSSLEGASIEPVELQDGSLEVKGCGCVHGIVEVQGRPGDWDGAQATISGGPGGTYGPETSASSGYWQICNVVEGDYDVAVEMARYLDGLKTGVSITDAGDTDAGQVKVLGGDCNDSDGPLSFTYGIDGLDASIVATDFGKTSGFDVKADINDSGNVNILDAALLGGNWHKSSPVPW